MKSTTDIKEQFQEKWSLERLKTMSLEEYTNLENSSFCYWIERVTSKIGGIGGGSSYKFGIFKKKGEGNPIGFRRTDGQYSWHSKYGESAEEAYASIKNLVITIAKAATDEEWSKIDGLDLGHSVKWKIASLYTDKIVHIFKKSDLQTIAKKLGIEKKKPKTSDIYSFLLSKKQDADIETFSRSLYQLRESNKKYWMYAPGEQARLWDTFVHSGEMGLGWDNLGDLTQYSDKDEMNQYLNKIEGTEANRMNVRLANYQFCNDMNIGDIVFAKKGSKELVGMGVVKSDYYFDDSKPEYFSRRKVDWKINKAIQLPFDLSLKTLTDVTNYDTKYEGFQYYHNVLEAIVSEQIDPLSLMQKTETISLPSLNIILYGPPGTGKTYKLQNEYINRFTEETRSTEQDRAKEVVNNHAWWEIISMAVYDLKSGKVADIFAHPLVQLKTAISTTKTPRNTIWAWLQRHTKNECPNVNLAKRNSPQYFWKDEHSVWSIDAEMFENETTDLFEVYKKLKSSSKSSTEIRRYEFVTFHQSYAYEEFIEGIKPKMSDGDSADIEYEIKQGVFLNICNRAKLDPDHDYCLFIDEINRGNVSAIFGELITLIETDKRAGNENEIAIKLPYSGMEFSVPKNLYIIGTMNTADRSVEALDSALRRRFSFIEMLPDSDVIDQQEVGAIIEGISVRDVLDTINKRIEALLSRDYLIGHSYFLNLTSPSELMEAFANKVIPLLQEYFYNDYYKLLLVLGPGFVSKVSVRQDDALFAIDHADVALDETRYAIKPFDWDFDIVDAVNKLLRTDD